MSEGHFDPYWMDQAKIAFAALCGGMVRLLFRPSSSIAKSAWLLFACVTCGYYGTPPLMHYMAAPVEFAGAIGAAIGFAGLSIAEGMLKAIDGFDFRQLLARFIAK